MSGRRAAASRKARPRDDGDGVAPGAGDEVSLRWYKSLKPRMRRGHEIELLESGAQYFPALERAIDEAGASVYLETYIFEDDPTVDASAPRSSVPPCVASACTWSSTASAPRSSIRFGPGRCVKRACCSRSSGPIFAAIRWIASGFAGCTERWSSSTARRRLRGRNQCARRPLRSEPRGTRASATRLRGARARTLVAQAHVAAARLWWETATVNRVAHGGKEVSTRELLQLPAKLRSDVASSGNVRAALMLRDNLRHRRTIERAYLRAIGRARSEVLIACAYFFPGGRFRRALKSAVRRGVRVRLLLQVASSTGCSTMRRRPCTSRGCARASRSSSTDAASCTRRWR